MPMLDSHATTDRSARLQSRPLLCPRLRADAFSDFYVIDFKSPFEMGFSWGAVTPLQWIWLVHALVVGQGFNTAIYRAIGKAGVYYGYRLDEPVPWVTGFPFSVVPHPQYFGVCMCVIGVNIFVATPQHISAGFFNLTMVQVLYYVYMGLVEDYL